MEKGNTHIFYTILHCPVPRRCVGSKEARPHGFLNLCTRKRQAFIFDKKKKKFGILRLGSFVFRGEL
jgi:hypothetical protein